MRKKHLVLDHDVHLRLQKRKKSTGLTQQSIGNLILRSALSQPNLLMETVGKKLADSGAIQPEEYEEIVKSAIRDIGQTASTDTALLEPGPGDSLVAGSWQIEQLYCSPDNSFQVVEAWARNARNEPVAHHMHSEDEFVVVLSGCVMLEDAGRHTLLLEPGSQFRIQSGHLHSLVPLGRDVQTLITFVPAGPLFCEAGAFDR
jgi:mannose-6-phosphate isomerase-like protein (cupin superfamily)